MTETELPKQLENDRKQKAKEIYGTISSGHLIRGLLKNPAKAIQSKAKAPKPHQKFLVIAGVVFAIVSLVAWPLWGLGATLWIALWGALVIIIGTFVG